MATIVPGHAVRMSTARLLPCSAVVVMVVASAIEPDVLPRQPTGAEGTVTPTGKFVPAAPAAASATAATADLIVATGPDRFVVGGRIVLDRSAGTVSVPAVVNMRHGQVEYLLVSEQGKRHEAVFRTEVRPEHLHLACLLGGLPTESVSSGRPARTSTIAVEMVWHRHGPPARVPLMDLVRPAPEAPVADPAVPPGRWIYNGSTFTAAGFAAQVEGSFIALIADPSALINGQDLPPGPYVPVADRLPAEGTPVSLVLHLPVPGTRP